jgi:glutamate---cysteine ligase / carboxylate-amine ligase
MTVRKVGVEEELLLVEPGTGRPLAVAETALGTVRNESAREHADADAAQALELEFQRQQLETNTKACQDLNELGAELRRCRALAAEVAARAGARVAALATFPGEVEPAIVHKGRYQRMAQAYGLTADEQLTCGCHVHVDISSPEEGIAVLDRIRPWLPVLLALSANSPYWQGQDSGYASFRYQAWGRWPSAGPTGTFGSVAAYRRTVQQMLDTGALLDTGMLYFDARPSEHYPTLEIRIADVCLYADDAALIAGLARALVETESRHWKSGADAADYRLEVLRLASWRASRSGLDDALLNPLTGQPEPAKAVVNGLLAYVGDALDEAGDTAAVSELLDTVLARGSGTAFQRDAARNGSLAAMMDSAANITAD